MSDGSPYDPVAVVGVEARCDVGGIRRLADWPALPEAPCACTPVAVRAPDAQVGDEMLSLTIRFHDEQTVTPDEIAAVIVPARTK